MKSIAFILALFMTLFTAKPLMHEMMHNQESVITEMATLVNHVSQAGSDNCCTRETGEKSMKCCGAEASENSCCTEDSRSGNCCGEKGECHGHCHCAFSSVSLFHMPATPQAPVALSEIEVSSDYTSLYTFTMPEMIWHPPKNA